MPKEHLPEDEQQTKESRAHAQRSVSRGFFIALALCIIAVGGVAASTFSETLQSPSENIDSAATTITSRPTVTTVVTPAGVTAVKTTTKVTTVPSLTTTSASSALFVLPLSNEVLTPFS